MSVPTMRAIVVERFGDTSVLELRDVPVPAPAVGEILVKVVAAGVNPVDAQNRTDGSWAGIEPPYIPGSDASGVVVGLGPEVSDYGLGDEVFYFSDFLGNRHGSYAQLQAVPAAIVTLKPAGLTHVQAAAVPLAAGTAYEVVTRRLALEAGESCLIVGAGGSVGEFAVQLAVHAGARVVAVAGARHHARLREFGAEIVIDRWREEFVAAVRSSIGQVDAVADLAGRDSIARALDLVRPGGRLATIVELRGDFDKAIDRNLTVHGVLVRPDGRRLAALAELLTAGVLRVRVAEVLDLTEARRAHGLLESGDAGGKVVLTTE